MKHSIQLKREDTGEVLVISSQICGDKKRLFFAVLEKEPEIKCREIPVTVYDHEENKITDLREKEMIDREIETLKHFGYNKPLGIVGASQHNKQPFDYFAEVIKLMKLDETRKTRIVFDYDPNFAHCLTQVITFP